jgi:hypothetical protein
VRKTEQKVLDSGTPNVPKMAHRNPLKKNR